MGKACIHFKSADDLALDVVGQIVATIPLDRWVPMAQDACWIDHRYSWSVRGLKESNACD